MIYLLVLAYPFDSPKTDRKVGNMGALSPGMKKVILNGADGLIYRH